MCGMRGSLVNRLCLTFVCVRVRVRVSAFARARSTSV